MAHGGGFGSQDGLGHTWTLGTSWDLGLFRVSCDSEAPQVSLFSHSAVAPEKTSTNEVLKSFVAYQTATGFSSLLTDDLVAELC